MVGDGSLGHRDTQGVGEWEGQGWSVFGHVTVSSG